MIQPADKDNDFDDLIREAGDKYNPTGANPDWDHMQTLLDIHMPVRKIPRRRGYYLFILLFLLSGSTYLFLNKARDSASVPAKDQQAAVNPASRTVTPQTVNPAVEEKKGGDDKIQQALVLKNKEKVQSQKKTGTNGHTNLKIKAGRINTHTLSGEVAENKPSPESGADAPSVDKKNSLVAPGIPAEEIATQDLSTVTGANDKLNNKTAAPVIIINESKIPDDKNIAAENKKGKTHEKIKRPFEFSLLYAPELTTIWFSNIDKPGSNFGLLVGYHLSKNLVIQTGIVKSRKNYIADGEDFEMEYNPVAHKLNKVDGYCDMYEIPLNIKSQISKGKKLNWFYTAGISSYFMKSEFYTYNYATANGSYDKSVSYNTQRNYWFSLATAGLGVEKEITNSFNIAAMPFIKIPFTGMGKGNLPLLGTGINFTLTYRPSFHKD